MGRSVKKGPFIDLKLVEKVKKQEEEGKGEPIKTWSRACTVIPEFINQSFLVHNGKNFVKVFVTEDMVGHKLGEFAATRVFRGHSGKKEKQAPAGR